MEWSDEKGYSRVIITSEDLLDPVGSLAEMQEILSGGERPRVMADLSSIHELQSIQIGTLVAMHLTAYENLCILEFVNIQPRVKTLLKTVGLHYIIESHHGKKVMERTFGKK